jgi:hypothetical protein
MQDWNEQLFEIIGRSRQNQKISKAAAIMIKNPDCPMIVSNNPDWDRTGGKGKAAASTQTVVKKYDMGGSSTGEPIYQCGTHNFETKSLNGINNHINTIHGNGSGSGSGSGSKAASAGYDVSKAKAIYDFITAKRYNY